MANYITNVTIDGTQVNIKDAETSSEVIDARTGYDGKIYPLAGDAVRGQASQLSESITEISDDIYVATANLLDINAVEKGKQININKSNQAIVADSTNWNLTDYIAVSPSVTYLMKVFDFDKTLGYRVIGYCFDENKNYLNYADDKGTWGQYAFDKNDCKILKTVAGTKYIRVQYQKVLDSSKELQIMAEYVNKYHAFKEVKFATTEYVTEYVDEKIAEGGQGSNVYSGDYKFAWYLSNAVKRADYMLARQYNTAKAKKMIDTNIFSLMQSGDVFQHDCTSCYHLNSNVLYCVYVNNKVNQGDNPKYNEAYVRLTALQCVSDGRITNIIKTIDICKNGDVIDGYTIASGAGVPNAFLDGDNLYIIWSAKGNDGNWYEFNTTYHCDTGSLGTSHVCRMSGQDMSCGLISSKFNLATNEPISLNASITKMGDYYYACACAEDKWTNGVILRTQNFSVWEYVGIPLFEGYDSHGIFEGAMGSLGGNLYLALRQVSIGSDTPLILAKMDSSANVSEYVCIPSVSSRPSFFMHGTTELYLAFSTDERRNTVLMYIDSVLSKSVPMQDIAGYGNYLTVTPRTANLQFISFTTGTTGIRVSSMNGLQKTSDEIMSAFVEKIGL